MSDDNVTQLPAKSSYRAVRKRLNEVMPTDGVLRCRSCDTPTKYDTLSSLGAMCARCYDLYCVEKCIPAGGCKDDPLGWAKLLKAREESGEYLPPLYREMWRDALRFRGE